MEAVEVEVEAEVEADVDVDVGASEMMEESRPWTCGL